MTYCKSLGMFYSPKQMLGILRSCIYTYNLKKLLSVVKTVSSIFILAPQQHVGSFLMKAPTCIIFFPIQQSIWKDEKILVFEEAQFSSDKSFKKRGAWIFISFLRIVATLSSRPHWADLAYRFSVQTLQWRDTNGRIEVLWSCLSLS